MNVEGGGSQDCGVKIQQVIIPNYPWYTWEALRAFSDFHGLSLWFSEMTEEEMLDLALQLSKQEASSAALRMQQEEEDIKKAIEQSVSVEQWIEMEQKSTQKE